MTQDITIEEAAKTLRNAGLKVSRISGTGQLRTEFPRGYYVSIGEHVARELAAYIKGNPRIDPTVSASTSRHVFFTERPWPFPCCSLTAQ